MPASTLPASLNRRETLHFVLLNLGHLLDHLCLLVFATAAALTLHGVWGLSYAELLPYATASFVAFGALALPAGYLADRWSREGMMVVFFFGGAGAMILCAMADSPMQLALALTLLGAFAAIYHPVGLALVIGNEHRRAIRLAINGVWGNLGVASAALLTAWMIDIGNWRAAYLIPGFVFVVLGLIYLFYIFLPNRAHQRFADDQNKPEQKSAKRPDAPSFSHLKRILLIIMATTAVGGLVFQSTTFALPRIVDERLSGLVSSTTGIGWLAFGIFAIGSCGQLVVGYLLDRVSLKLIFVGVALIQIAGFLVMINATGMLALITAAVFMLAVFGQIPINDVLIGRIAATTWRSRILGIRYTINITVMSLTLPLISVIYRDHGFSRLFMILSLAACAIAALVTMLPANTASEGTPK